LQRRLDYALAESTKSFKGPLEHRYYAMTKSLWVVRLAVLELRGCTTAYLDDDPEVSWIVELLSGLKLTATIIQDLALNVRRLRGVQRSLISGIISGPILEWATPDDPEARVKKETLSLRQAHQIVCGLLEALTELRRDTLACWKILGECKDHFFPRVLAEGEASGGATYPKGSLKPSGCRTASTAPALTKIPHPGGTEANEHDSIPESGREVTAESEREKQREARGSDDARQDLRAVEASGIARGGADQRQRAAVQVAREIVMALERAVWRNEERLKSQVPDNRGGPPTREEAGKEEGEVPRLAVQSEKISLYG
jgi:hypothetical protein